MLLSLDLHVQGLLTALGIGLMIGVVRERMHATPQNTIAGIRTHSLLSLVAAVAMTLGLAVFAVLLLVVGGLAMFAYRRSAHFDAGLTGEVALLATAVLGAYAQQDALRAAAIAVVVAALLFAKRPLQRFAREIISQQEMQDALMLAGAALLVLPWLPREAVDPWSVLVPARLWSLVILLMTVGMLGEVSLRIFGARWGYVLSGLLAGLASSTAVVASFGSHARVSPNLLQPSLAAALLATVASLALFAGVLTLSDIRLLAQFGWPLAATAAALLAWASLGIVQPVAKVAQLATGNRQVFRLSQALLLGCVIACLLLLSAWLRQWLGAGGGVVAAMLVAVAEVHAAAAGVAQLFHAGLLQPPQLQWCLLAVLATSFLAKVVVAFIAGGRQYGSRLAVAFGTALLAGALAIGWRQI